MNSAPPPARLPSINGPIFLQLNYLNSPTTYHQLFSSVFWLSLNCSFYLLPFSSFHLFISHNFYYLYHLFLHYVILNSDNLACLYLWLHSHYWCPSSSHFYQQLLLYLRANLIPCSNLPTIFRRRLTLLFHFMLLQLLLRWRF